MARDAVCVRLTALLPEGPAMADATTELATLLRRAGYDLPDAARAEMAPGHALMRAMLARLGTVPTEAEPATIFRPETTR
jgi:hypothetical protein